MATKRAESAKKTVQPADVAELKAAVNEPTNDVDTGAEKIGAETEKNTLKAIASTGVVETIIPLDPTMPPEGQFFEHCINGVVYRFQRGEVVKIPTAIFETIKRKAEYKRIGLQVASAFQGNGKLIEV